MAEKAGGRSPCAKRTDRAPRGTNRRYGFVHVAGGPGKSEGGPLRRETKPLRPARRHETNPPRPPARRAPNGPNAPARDEPKANRPLGPGDSERTERGLGKSGVALPAVGRDSERTERGAGDPGQELPTGRGGAERTQRGARGAKTNPTAGPRRAKRTQRRGCGRAWKGIGGWFEGVGGWTVAARNEPTSDPGPPARRTNPPATFVRFAGAGELDPAGAFGHGPRAPGCRGLTGSRTDPWHPARRRRGPSAGGRARFRPVLRPSDGRAPSTRDRD
jgi:hypothetical protein